MKEFLRRTPAVAHLPNVLGLPLAPLVIASVFR